MFLHWWRWDETYGVDVSKAFQVLLIISDSQLPNEGIAYEDELLVVLALETGFVRKLMGEVKRRSTHMGKQTLSAQQDVYVALC